MSRLIHSLVAIWLVAAAARIVAAAEEAVAAPVNVQSCVIEDDPGLFAERPGQCEYTVGEQGTVSSGWLRGTRAEIVAVGEGHVLFRAFIPIDMIQRHGEPITDLFLWANQDGNVVATAADSKDGKAFFFGNDVKKNIKRRQHQTQKKDKKEKQQRPKKKKKPGSGGAAKNSENLFPLRIEDCWDEAQPYARITKPDGTCEFYLDPMPPVSKCKQLAPGEIKTFDLNSDEFLSQPAETVYHSIIEPIIDLENGFLVIQDLPQYGECEMEYIDYNVGTVLETYGGEEGLFTRRVIDIDDIPPQGIVYIKPLIQMKGKIYFHSYKKLSRYFIDPLAFDKVAAESPEENDVNVYTTSAKAALTFYHINKNADAARNLGDEIDSGGCDE